MSQDGKHRKFSKEFRESALRRLALTPNVAELCRELGISRQLLYLWRDGKQREQDKRSQGAERCLRQENIQLQKALLKRSIGSTCSHGCLLSPSILATSLAV